MDRPKEALKYDDTYETFLSAFDLLGWRAVYVV